MEAEVDGVCRKEDLFVKACLKMGYISYFPSFHTRKYLITYY